MERNLFDLTKENRPRAAAACLFSAVFSLCFSWYRGLSPAIDRVLLLFVFCFLLSFLGLLPVKRRAALLLGLFSLVLSFFQIAGHTVRTETGVLREWTPALLFPFLLIALSFWLLLRGLTVVCLHMRLCGSSAEKPAGKGTWLLLFLLLLFLWLPALLAMGPRLSADSAEVIDQAFSGALDDMHPVLYTLLLRAAVYPFYLRGDPTAGAYLFCFLQMCLLAAILSYSLYWLGRRGCPVWFLGLGFLYFTLTTVFAVNAITIWKDILFGAVLLLLVLLLFEAEEKEAVLQQRGYLLRFLAVSVSCCFLRGNGWMLVLASGLFLGLLYQKRAVRLVVSLLLLVAAVKLVTGPLYNRAGIANSLGPVESAAMPLQQVARVVSMEGELSDEQRAFLGQIMDLDLLAEVYNPISPDYIKGHPAFQRAFFTEHFSAFLRLWLDLLPANKTEYVNAWLLETLGYWHVGFRGRTGVYYTDYNGYRGILQHDLLSPVLGRSFVRDIFYRDGEFLSLALMAFLALYAAVLAGIRKNKKRLAPLAVFLLLWIGMLIGAPTYYDFRYMLLFAYGLPVLVFLLLRPPAAQSEEPL